MLQPVAYSIDELEFVLLFEESEPKLSMFWSSDECKGIRAAIKAHYRSTQGNTCCYCRQTITVDHGRAWDAEHIVPRQSHPQFMFTPQNLSLACPDCNGFKSNQQTLGDPGVVQYPTSGDAFLIVHPHFDDYSAHIEKGIFTYVRRSAKGEWTIEKCNLTRFAGREFGWPDPIVDSRYEDNVDAVFAGGVEPVDDIRHALQAAFGLSTDSGNVT